MRGDGLEGAVDREASPDQQGGDAMLSNVQSFSSFVNKDAIFGLMLTFRKFNQRVLRSDICKDISAISHKQARRLL